MAYLSYGNTSIGNKEPYHNIEEINDNVNSPKFKDVVHKVQPNEILSAENTEAASSTTPTLSWGERKKRAGEYYSFYKH